MVEKLREIYEKHDLISVNYGLLEELENKAVKLRHLKESYQLNADSERIYDETIERIEKQKELILKEINDYMQLFSELRERLSRINNANYERVLTERFFNCKTFEKIAHDMGYSMRQTRRFYNAALEVFETL